MKVKFDKLLKNKIVLYVVFLIALFTIFNFIYKQNYHAALFFILVAFLARYFSNNMIIILGISIIATYLLDLFRVFSIGYLEGMGTKNTHPQAKPSAKASAKDSDEASAKDSDEASAKDSDEALAKASDEGKGKSEGDESGDESNIFNTPNTPYLTKQEKEINKAGNAFTNMKLNPANLEYKQGSGNLSKQADDKELAYDNLEKLLSSDQVRGMSSDAKSLTDKQNQIMSQLKDMKPLVNQALKFLKDFDMSTINNMGDKLESAIGTLQNIKSQ